MANIFQRLFSTRKQANLSDTRRAFRVIGGQLVPYKYEQLTYIERGYTYNDLIYSVAKKVLDKATVAPWSAYKIVDEKSFLLSRALMKKVSATSHGDTSKDYQKAMMLAKKSLVAYEGDGRLTELLKWPNEEDTWSQHNYGLFGYKLITGNSYEAGWDKVPSGGLNKGKIGELYQLPSQFMNIRSGSGLPLKAEGYELALGQMLPFDKRDVLHEKYWNPEWDVYGISLYGMSPIKAYLKRLQRNNNIQIRGAKVAENGGADVIVYLDDPTADEDFAIEQTSKLKKTWVNEQYGAENAGKAVFTTNKLGHIKLGYTPVELDALESEKFDLQMACHIFGVPPVLFSTDASTYNNMNTGERSLTANCAVPLCLDREASFNKKLRSLPAYKDSNIWISPDFSVYTELEENKKEQVDWLEKSALPLQRRYEILGEDVPEWFTEEQRRAIFVPNSWVPLDDALVPPAENMDADEEALNQRGLNPYK